MNLKKASDSFFHSFIANHVILYVGQNANDDELKTYISKCPWSGIITSRRDFEFAALFANEERSLCEYSGRTEIPGRPFNRKKVPILRLFGVQGEQREEEDLSWLRTGTQKQTVPGYDMNRARDMLQLLPELLEHINSLVIIGADSEIDWKLFGEEFASLLYTEVSEGTVSIWDMPACIRPEYAEAYGILKKVAEKKNFGFYELSLGEMIRMQKTEFDRYFAEDIPIPDYDSDVYYQGDTPVNITQEDLLLFKNVGTLLTERTLHKIHPLGRVMSRKWFSIFLESSASFGPQWYGYLPQSTFYVKRSYEDALVQLVHKVLDGRDIHGRAAENRLVVLAGDPGSSKSITLGALAYRVYCEHIHPVIFISKDSFLSANMGTGFDELDEVLQLLEKKAPTDTRILVIWDSSAYRTGVDQARNLMERLQNRGRRFVLVCSSYNICTRQDEKNRGFYALSDASKGKFEACDQSRAQVLDRAGGYYVRAIREMNAQEQMEFWKRTKEYAGIQDATISLFKRKMADENRTEIFDYYYMLISVLRENLELSLKSEQSKVSPYVEEELKKAIGEIHTETSKDRELSPVYQAFLAAGFDPSRFMDGADDQEAPDGDTQVKEELTQKLDTFNLCVALFSRFKLSVPYSLAFTLLVGEDTADQYSGSSRQLYRIVTTEIPWIYYGEDEAGDFSFRFRNPLEADIYLRNHDFTGEQQVDLVCKIIDIYGAGYRRSKCKDLVFTDNLQALLRLMGPNSGYTPFQSASRQNEHHGILSKLDCLIDKLEDLWKVYGVPDEDAGFATIVVTFIREFYGAIWKKTYMPSENPEQKPWESDPAHFSVDRYEYRIKQLLRAITLAEQEVEAVENRAVEQGVSHSGRQHLMNQRDSLAVEIAQCNMRLEELAEEYVSCCCALSVEPKEELINRKLNYRRIYRQLWPVISGNPVNGYAYNALFKAFERMYQKEKLSEAKKLQYLSEIMQVVETCETLDREIVNRGSAGQDELTSHINNIKDFSTGLKITLHSIIRHRKGIPAENEQEQGCFDMYDEMLNANNAAAITFICQKELRFPKGTRQLNTDQLMRCQTVYCFMKEPDNFECIRSNAYALAMLIRVCWMSYNKTTLTATPECQLTRLNAGQWAELHHLCSMYDRLAGENKQPLIILLYALSALQVSGRSECGYREAMEILNSIDEDIFFQRRMWTPFMICNEKGDPYEYSGTVLSTKENKGFIHVNGVPQWLKKDCGVRFRQYNLGRNAKMPEPHDVLDDLELGIGYTGFSVYSRAGRKERGEKM